MTIDAGRDPKCVPEMTASAETLTNQDDRGAPNSWPLSSSLPLGVLPTAPSCARSHVRLVLAEWGMASLAGTAELVVSELVTNSVRASTDADGHPLYRGGVLAHVHVRMFADDTRLLLEVWDTIPAAPVAKHAAPDDETGRGLHLVDVMTASWGWTTVDDWPGKCVWAELEDPD
jgi:anti-sigma regulatory factor (Ser/Thr protein kinase)